jgi:hypothetical protein
VLTKAKGPSKPSISVPIQFSLPLPVWERFKQLHPAGLRSAEETVVALVTNWVLVTERHERQVAAEMAAEGGAE